MYEFGKQLGKGEAAERFLDAHYSRFFSIKKASRDEQRQGIDRFFEKEGESWPIEYKADWTASRTGNAFVETVSVDTTGKLGWAYTSSAKWLLYFLPDDGLVYVVEMTKLKGCLEGWKEKCKTVTVQNRTYSTHGLLVPLDLFEQIAQRVDSV
jgi:hypothetical protein